MRLPKFEYLEPKTIKEAANALAWDPKRSFLLAGGTDLLPNMKHRLIEPRRIISLKTLPKLSYITNGRSVLKIGALTTLHHLASSSVVREKFPVLSQAATEVGAYALQTMATLGGNLCQGNRCRFYNQSAFWRQGKSLCYKAGGDVCRVVRKPRECHSSYCGDMAPVLIALSARVNVAGPTGERTFPLKELYTQDGKEPLRLRKGEILKEILVPAASGKTVYIKWRHRESVEFPVVSLALHLEGFENEKIRNAKIIFGAVGSGPVEAMKAEKMLANTSLDNGSIEKVLDQAVKEISPMRTSIYSPSYKKKVARILLREALEKFQIRNNT